MKNQIPWNILLNQLEGKPAQPDPLFIEWIQNRENQRFWDELQVLYSINGNIPPSYQPDQAKGWKNIEKRTLKSARPTNYIRHLLRIAASVLLFISGAAGYRALDLHKQKDLWSEVVSPYGHKTMIMLPDSSTVWLNGNSKLKYKTDFSRGRVVALEGEALFDIRKQPKNLFSVNAGSLRVEVYGTKFNLRSFHADDEIEVALVKGSVGVFKDRQHLRTMNPGEVITYLPGQNKIAMSSGMIDQIISWQSGELIINNKPIDEVFGYLERWYGVKIEFSEKLLNGHHLSFKVKAESLRELLSIINKITPIRYTIDGEKVVVTKP